MPIIPKLKRHSTHEDFQFKASLSDIVKTCVLKLG